MSEPVVTPPGRTFRVPIAALVAVVAIGSLVQFARSLDSEPLFMDEAAYISQAYFGDLFLSGHVDSPLWLEYPGYDLPPLPKYLINLSLRCHGIARVPRRWAIQWYITPLESSFVTPVSLHAARLPSLAFGALGCVALFALGTLAAGPRVGVIAAGLLALNPLYRLHARRGMSDVPSEALILGTVALGFVLVRLCARQAEWTWRGVLLMALTGCLGGLAVLAKLNGGLGLMIVWAWLLLAASVLPMPWTGRISCILTAGLVGLMALVVFVALNPFVTARPASLGPMRLAEPVPPDQSIVKRLVKVVEHRASVSQEPRGRLLPEALNSLGEKAAAMAVQGFGRFSPFGPAHTDSRRRYDRAQDWGVVLWMPLVLIGFARTLTAGRSERKSGQFPAAWAVAVLFVVSVLTVGLFLPLAWDRYFMSIQAGSCLLVAIALVWAFDAVRGRGASR